MNEILERNPWIFIRHSVLLKDGTWESGKDLQEWKEPLKSKVYIEQHPYFYFTQLKGDQSCIATISVHEREWVHVETADRMIHKDIEVSFDKEVGNEAGSWKGGVIGCNYTMLPDEKPVDTLRRMEKERTF